MADYYVGSNHLNNKCTRNYCRVLGIFITSFTLFIGVITISMIVPLGFYGGLSGKPVTLSQGQTQIVEGLDSTFCSGISVNITSKRTTVTLYRLSKFPQNPNITINSYITESAIESCSAGRGHGRICTVSNDPSSTYVVTASSGPPHERSVRVPIKCQLAGGPIAGIVLGIVVVYTIFCAGLLASILCCAQCIDKSK